MIHLSGVAILLICLVTDALQLPTTRRDAVISAVAGVFGAPTIAWHRKVSLLEPAVEV